MAPGANMSDEIAFFEATHGTAPKYAGQDKVNPGSLILSGVMMLEHLGWDEAADARAGRRWRRRSTQKTVTYDLARQMEGGARGVAARSSRTAIIGSGDSLDAPDEGRAHAQEDHGDRRRVRRRARRDGLRVKELGDVVLLDILEGAAPGEGASTSSRRARC